MNKQKKLEQELLKLQARGFQLVLARNQIDADLPKLLRTIQHHEKELKQIVKVVQDGSKSK